MIGCACRNRGKAVATPEFAHSVQWRWADSTRPLVLVSFQRGRRREPGGAHAHRADARRANRPLLRLRPCQHYETGLLHGVQAHRE